MTPLIYLRIGLFMAIFATGFYAGNRWEAAKIGPLQAEISRLQARESILENSNAQCASNVEAANNGTKQLLAEGQANATRSAAALKAAQVESAKVATSIATIRALAPPADDCNGQGDASRLLFQNEMKSRAK